MKYSPILIVLSAIAIYTCQPLSAEGVPFYHKYLNPEAHREIFRFKRKVHQPDCHPDKLELMGAVKMQARAVADYLRTHTVSHQVMLDEYWKMVADRQDYFIRACYNESLGLGHLSGQALLPYLLQQQMPDEYAVFVDHGMPENQISDRTVYIWMERLSEAQVSDEGELIGCCAFAEFDTGWLLTGVNYIAQAAGLTNKAPFNTTPGTAQLTGNQLKLVLVGDWGTDTPSARAVMSSIREENADIVIHLGDIYYSGNPEEVNGRFLPGFTFGTDRALMLNANHEMDGGGLGYFPTLARPEFSLQQNSSFFALEFGSWVIIGLDSAYYASGVQYKPGRIVDDAQLNLLRQYRDRNSRMILLSHHNPISVRGDEPFQLWHDVAGALQSQMPAYWYYGHKHAGVAYSDRSYAGLHNTTTRCSGHGGMPIGRGAGFFEEDGSLIDTIDFYAQATNPGNPPQVANGYVVLTIKGEEITESFHDQNGLQLWPDEMTGETPAP